MLRSSASGVPCVLALLAGCAVGILVQKPVEQSLDADARSKFGTFIKEHGRTYVEDSEEYVQRLALFQGHLSAVEAHNKQPNRLWTAGVTHLADWTPEELASLRGYRHGMRPGGGGGGRGGTAGLGLVAVSSRAVDLSHLPKDVNYTHLAAMQDIQNQGSCGSCWAVSTATVLRAHAELYQKDRTFSIQQILSCTPNPKKCGGAGGCQGATAELAMDYIARVGSLTEDELKYAARDEKCPSGMEAPRKNLRQTTDATSFAEVSISGGGGASFGMTGWKRLPENRAEPLMLALYEHGPAVVSVAASGPWNMYLSGIMNSCEKGAVINHAVALVGYGEDDGNRYWTIQNSWGSGWGEHGLARLLRLDSSEENGYCGWDTSPGDGTGCEGGPAKVWVCGSCGIIYDSVVPKFELGRSGLLFRTGRRNLTGAA